MTENQASARDPRTEKVSDLTTTDHQGCTQTSSSSRYGDFLESKNAQVSKFKESPVGSPAKSHQNSLHGSLPVSSPMHAGSRSVSPDIYVFCLVFHSLTDPHGPPSWISVGTAEMYHRPSTHPHPQPAPGPPLPTRMRAASAHFGRNSCGTCSSPPCSTDSDLGRPAPREGSSPCC